MGQDPRTSVTDKWGRTHDIPNLFVCDGSLLPTQGSANPGLTIQALAVRTADYLISNAPGLISAHPEHVSYLQKMYHIHKIKEHHHGTTRSENCCHHRLR